MTVPVPIGFGLALDPRAKRIDDTTLFGGAPARILRLTPTGRAALDEVLAGQVRTGAGGALARRLTDAGVMHPRPADAQAPADLTVIVPVRDRPEGLAACLHALEGRFAVTVVDDGSASPEQIAKVCAEYGATLIRRESCGGPGPARNTGLAHTDGERVAFLDSDCIASPTTIDRLAAHLADPLVAAAAPRITALDHAGSIGGYTRVHGSLDLGEHEARVVPLTPVSYVPTAALVARRSALRAVAPDGRVFDPQLRYGEDVDLVWRLHGAGWRVRYDPSVTVRHAEPATWADLLARRYRYGTSAGRLARRHPRSMAPFVIHPWSTLSVLAALAGQPVLAAAAFGTSLAALRRTLRATGVAPTGSARGAADAVQQTWLGLGRYATQFAAPFLIAGALRRGRAWRRVAAGSLLLGPPLRAWMTARPALDPVRFTAAHVADDVAYGAGVWAGALRARTLVPLRPILSRRMVRLDSPSIPGGQS